MSGTAPRLRVAVLTRNFSGQAGGAERYAMALVEQLAARHEIHVFAQSVEHANGIPIPGVTYHAVSMPFRKPRWVNQLWFATATWWGTRAASGSRFDVVHAHENTWHGNVQTVHVLPVRHNLFVGRSGVKVALRWLKVLTSPRLLAYLWLERQRYAPNAGRAVVVTSESLRSIFVAAYPRAAGMTSVITPGIALPAVSAASAGAAAKSMARQKLGLPVAGNCVLFVGNDFQKKGLQTLLEAIGLLQASDTLPTSSLPFLAVVGHCAQQPHFRQQAERLGIASQVYFLGGLDDVSLAYRAADCLAHPTREDTFAMVVLEAMAHALPVVVSDARYCGISGLLADDINALILDDPRDPALLAALLQRVLSDPALRRQLSAGARELASGHQWSDVARLQEALYLQVADPTAIIYAS
ncbi:MAG: glycosyltransferase family 1 protein [Polaromonas sp.]|nr:glycosyltransferase family 1 protein [Polaromonas sp.]